MNSDFFDVPGDIVDLSQLEIAKVYDLVFMLVAGQIPFARFIECRKLNSFETVIIELDVEVPQLCRYPILPSERIAITFHEMDTTYPIIHALREDFPIVPHLNLHIQEFPRNLCIFDERYEELKRVWTSPRFIQRIRNWFSLTAQGKLHQEDQPLEQVLIDHAGYIVLPESLWEITDDAQPLSITSIGPIKNEKLFLIAREKPNDESANIVASIHQCPPQTHGVIHRKPLTLADLASMVDDTGFDICVELRERLKNWKENNNALLDSHILLIIRFPLKRSDDSKVEAYDVWAFFLGDASKKEEEIFDLRVRDLGVKIGLWEIQDKHEGLLIPPDTSKRGDDVIVEVLNVSYKLTREVAAKYNGNASVEDVQIVAIGVGALGSQTVLNLARNGFGIWTIIDHDSLMPHNLARHALTSQFIGWKKAEAVALLANDIVGDPDLFTALPADILRPRKQEEEVKSALRNAEVILDMSTSIAVARKLARDTDSDARCASFFMSPSGRALVLLAEDKSRTTPLDNIEMQYYRAAVNNIALADHLHTTEEWSRYGQSCRDISSTLNQNFVALHAAIGAQEIMNAISAPNAIAAIWQMDDKSNKIHRIDISLYAAIHHQAEDWTVVTDNGLLEKLKAFREEKLPNETGGVLLGSFDLARKIVYVVDALPSPPDSEEWPPKYVRGKKGLPSAVDSVSKKTLGMLNYIGEWHSHPPGTSTAASPDDFEVFTWLTKLMMAEGLPAVMIIIGDPGRVSCYVSKIMDAENLLRENSVTTIQN